MTDGTTAEDADGAPPYRAWLRSVLDASPDAILIVDRTGRVRAAGKPVEALLGYRPDAIVGQPIDRLLDRRGVAAIASCRKGAGAAETAATGYRADGSRIALDLWLAGASENSDDIACILRRTAVDTAKAPRPDHIDPLTGLANRAGLLHRLQGGRSQLVALHLIGFDMLATSIGRRPADRLVAEVAARLRAAIVEGEVLARIGDGAFAVGCCVGSSASDCAQRLQRAFDEPFIGGRQPRYLTAAIGISTEEPDAERALADAEMACRAEQGPSIRHFDAGLRIRHQDRLEIETALHRALRSGSDELYAAYQPIFDMRTGQVVGCEALARWQHPTLGEVPPATFVPIAETAGLIGLLGEHICRMSAEALTGWNRRRATKAQAPAFVSINLSAGQFADPALVDRLARILHIAGVDPRQVQLELTESCLLGPGDDAVATLERFKELGFAVFIDDFGTGYSNFSYLQHLPIDGLKIDRSFVGAMTGSPRALDIVRVMIDLAHGMDLPVVAEGIETEAACTALRALGCDYAQGMLLASPGPSGPGCRPHPLLQPRPDSQHLPG